MNHPRFLFGLAATAMLLAGTPAAQAVHLKIGAVTPLDTFSFDIAGFNTGGGSKFLTPLETGTFGTTTTFVAAGQDGGQNITITSSETFGATTTTDTFTVSTPVSFVTDATYQGVLINGLQFDLGDANSGGNQVALSTPISGYTNAGSFTDGSGGSVTTTPLANFTTVLGNDSTSQLPGSSFSTAEGVNTGNAATAINSYDVHVFTYSITYGTVPEPGTWAMLALGAVVGAGAIIRRRVTA